MKIINIILGLGTAIILGALIHLGIRAFHPAPVSPYSLGIYPKAAPYREFNCDKTDTKCIADRDTFYKQQQVQQEETDKQNRAYDAELKIYNSDVFVIANVVGTLVFIAGFLILFKTAIASQSVPIGIMIAGLYGIVYGYATGWNSVNDRLKFFVGLMVALLVIGGSIWLIERYSKRIGKSIKRNESGFAPIVVMVLVALALVFAGGSVYYARRAKIRSPLACTGEVKRCADGSYISRVPPSCEFQSCLTEASTTTRSTISAAPFKSVKRVAVLPVATSTSVVLPPTVHQGGADWKIYRNVKYGFWFKYPADHTAYLRLDNDQKVLVSAGASDDAVMVAEDERALFSAPAQAVVLKVVFVNEDIRLDDWVNQNLSKYVIDVNSVSRRKVAVSGKAAVEITQPAQGTNSPHKVFVIQPGNFLIVITESAPSTLLDQIFATFKFIQ